jgi:hypothetical protein
LTVNDAGVRVDGLRELRREFKAAEGHVKDFSAVNRAVAAVVAPVAKRNAPVLSGALASTIKGSGTATAARIVIGGKPKGQFYVTRRTRRGEVRVYRNRPITDVRYAYMVEARQRFVRDAIDQTQPEWFGLWEREIDQIVKRFERG